MEKLSSVRKRFDPAQRARILEGYERTELSQKEFAPENGISLACLTLWRRKAYTYEIVELIPSGCLTMRTSEGPFPMETHYTWKPVTSETTHMTLSNVGSPTGFFKFVVPFMAIAMRRANRKDLACLKALLERPDCSYRTLKHHHYPSS